VADGGWANLANCRWADHRFVSSASLRESGQDHGNVRCLTDLGNSVVGQISKRTQSKTHDPHRPSGRWHPACRAATVGSVGELRSPKPAAGKIVRPIGLRRFSLLFVGPRPDRHESRVGRASIGRGFLIGSKCHEPTIECERASSDARCRRILALQGGARRPRRPDSESAQEQYLPWTAGPGMVFRKRFIIRKGRKSAKERVNP